MKDYDELPNQKPKNHVPRAKMYLRAHLRWLWGYPLGEEGEPLQWQVLHYPLPWDAEILSLSTEYLAHAAFAYNRAKHAFPKALPVIVGDVELWSTRVSLKLQALRSLLEGELVDPWQVLLVEGESGQGRLVRQVQALKRQNPLLTSLLDKFAWWLSLDPKALQQAVDWLEEQQQALVHLKSFENGVVSIAILFALQRELPVQTINSFLPIIIHPVWRADGIFAYKSWFNFYFSYFERFPLGDRVDFSLAQVTESSEVLRNWEHKIQGFMALSPKQVRRFLEVSHQLLTPLVLDRWLLWCQQSRAYLEEVLAATERQRRLELAQRYTKQKAQNNEHLSSENIAKWKKAWHSLRDDSPIIPSELSDFLERLNYFAHDPKKLAWLEKAARLLERLPADHAWHRPDMLLKLATHWYLLKRDAESAENYADALVSAWLHYLQQAKSQEALVSRVQPWLKLANFYAKNESVFSSRSGLEIRMLRSATYSSAGFKLAEPSAFFTALGIVVESSAALDAQVAIDFYHFYSATPSAWPKAAYFCALLAHNLQIELQPEVYACVNRLLGADTSVEHFVHLIQSWHLAAHAEAPSGSWEAIRVAAVLIEQGHAMVVDKTRELGVWPWLAALKPSIEQLEKINLPVPAVMLYPASPSHFADYPIELQPALQLLATYHPQAEVAAQRILEDLRTDPVALNNEIKVIQQKLENTLPENKRVILERRLQSLTQRLAALSDGFHRVSPKRLANLSKKLYSSALQKCLTDWQQSCEQQLQQHLYKALYVKQLDPKWLSDKQHYKTLMALAGLSASERKLAGQLLAAELAGQYPLLQAPANQVWINNMHARGFKLQAWLEGFELYLPMTLGEKETIFTFRLAQRLFDVLHMGDHFETCLSHDGCNFFSVLANAADVNKRVLYAYDQVGKVQGRCLLAISDAGHLLHFYPYSHLAGTEFEQALHQVLQYLEQETGIGRHDKGEISTLVAQHWYNDGIINSAKHGIFAEQGEFRLALNDKQLSAEQVFTRFQALLEPESLSDMLLLQLIDLPELTKRYSLRLQLCLLWLEQGLLSHALQRELFEHLLHHSPPTIDVQDLWPLAKEWLWDYLYRYLQKNECFPATEFDLLLDNQPLHALKLLKVLHRPIKRIRFEYCRVLTEAQRAKVYLALNRPRQALAICHAVRRRYQDSDCYYLLDGVEASAKQRLDNLNVTA